VSISFLLKSCATMRATHPMSSLSALSISLSFERFHLMILHGVVARMSWCQAWAPWLDTMLPMNRFVRNLFFTLPVTGSRTSALPLQMSMISEASSPATTSESPEATHSVLPAPMRFTKCRGRKPWGWKANS